MAKTMQPQKMRFSQAIQTPMYKNLVNNTLGDPARGARFIANITSAVAVNPALQECNPGTILAGALLGESLLLQPSPQLGQFYLVPFKSKAKHDRQGNVIEPASVKAQFVLGYKGYIQLALRTGQYKRLNVLEVKAGELSGCEKAGKKEEGNACGRRYAAFLGWVALMILGFKGFKPGLIATLGDGSYQYQPGEVSKTEKAKCANTGFHYCLDPLDCLNWYAWDGKNEFWAIAAGGDIDEDDYRTRSSCTEIVPLRRLKEDEFLLMHANYVFEHPAEKFEDCFKRPFHIAYGQGKELAGARGEWLCFIVLEENEFTCIAQQVDGVKVLPGKNYTSESLEAAHNEKG